MGPQASFSSCFVPASSNLEQRLDLYIYTGGWKTRTNREADVATPRNGPLIFFGFFLIRPDFGAEKFGYPAYWHPRGVGYSVHRRWDPHLGPTPARLGL